MLSALVALPVCEMARKAAGAPVLDVKLAKDAQAAGKKLEGLETITDQLRAMASLPMEFHLKGLVDTLKLGFYTVMATTVIGYPLALVYLGARPRWQRLILFVVILPLLPDYAERFGLSAADGNTTLPS